MIERRSITVEGIVQGVGFRPFVYGLAREAGLAGFVGNDSNGVFIEVEGESAILDRFEADLVARAPVLAVVERVGRSHRPVVGGSGFAICESRAGPVAETLVSPDVATCADCLAEVFDPANRRFRYPFTNCTNCGPRFSIIRGVPYDRPLTTMAAFAMCEQCRAEYEDPGDRRFHAQPTCCPDCGPSLKLLDPVGVEVTTGDPIVETARLLLDGAVVAIKGIGGYHLAVMADDEESVTRLRVAKHREDKPFAVMAADLDQAGRLVELSDEAARLLTSARAPVVLAPRAASAKVAGAVAPNNRGLGVMLAYTPLHHLLAAELGRPFVLTSGNVSDEPIAYQDGDAKERLAPLVDFILAHTRPIEVRTDDSVIRVVGDRTVPIRRSRGYAPQPVKLLDRCARPILACGAELKATFCLARADHGFVSHHIGDLENLETYTSYLAGVEHFERLFDVHPEVVAHDLHPEYLSTKYGVARAEREGLAAIGVQHHHAHIASCLADNGYAGPAIGVAFDGLGYGLDGTLWGGEFLVLEGADFTRAAHLNVVSLPGGAAAIREPWRMAVAWLLAAGVDPRPLEVYERNRAQWANVAKVCQLGGLVTSSVGRLFDAVGALCVGRDRVNYEGQAAVELEQAADACESGSYRFSLESDGPADGPLVLDARPMVKELVGDLLGGETVGRIATRFHRGLAAALAETAGRIASSTGIMTVALSGGVFQNEILISEATAALSARGLAPLTHRQVPPNDGGISLGQVTVAARRLA